MSLPDDEPNLNPKTIAEHAAAYRRLRLQTIPCHDKVPVIPWKEFQDTLMPQGVFDGLYGPQGRFTGRSDMGIGIVMGAASGGLITLDLDTGKPGGKAENWYQGVIKVHNCDFDLETWEQKTGGGGRHLFFQCPEGCTVGNNTTDLDVDTRDQGGYAVVAPSPHPSGGVYSWLPGRAPWEIDLMVAPPWLLDEIERLILEHGGGSVSRIEAGERPVFDGFQRTSFGTITDGREKYMRDLIWAALIGYRIEQPIRPGKKELDFVYLDYSRNVKVQEPIPGESHEDGLEREERGYSKFTEKWNYALKQWDSKIEEAAGVRKARGVKSSNLTPQLEPPQIDPKTGKELPIILTAKQFAAGFEPPAYLIDGILQRGYLWALTASTHHGKTAVAMYMAQCIARGQDMHSHAVKKGRVLFLAGENSQDIRARFLVLAETYRFDPDDIDMHFIDGVVDLLERFPAIKAEADAIGDLRLVIVDTAAAYFLGDETNSNAQQGAFARVLRKMTNLKGRPAVLVNCHPVKKAQKDNLLPMGGSAFLNEIDGNLTLWLETEKQTIMHWQGKFRGPDFEPLHFDLRVASSPKVVDEEGRLMPNVVATPIANMTLEAGMKVLEMDENLVLEIIHSDGEITFDGIAQRAGFVTDGRPSKSKVQRIVKALADDKFVVKHRRGKYKLTRKGRREIGVDDDPNDE